VSSESTILRVFGQVAKREGADCELHPLIHTWLELNLVQDIENCQCFSSFGNESMRSEYIRFFLAKS
jgi:hypothetical protein